jgi:CBS domain-containing protein
MKHREPISKIMTANVYIVKESDPLREAVAAIQKNKIRHLPVLKGNEVCGIISSNDINRLMFGSLYDNQDGANEAIFDSLTIPQVMTTHPRTVSSHDTIKEVAEILSTSEFHALPVVDNGELKGIVTSTDIIKYMLEQY